MVLALLNIIVSVINDEHLGDLHGLVLRESVEREILTEHQVGQIKVIIFPGGMRKETE